MPSPTYEPCTKATPTSGTASGPLPHETVTYKSDAHPFGLTAWPAFVRWRVSPRSLFLFGAPSLRFVTLSGKMVFLVWRAAPPRPCRVSKPHIRGPAMFLFIPRSLCALKRVAAKAEHARFGATQGIRIALRSGLYRAEATDGHRAIIVQGLTPTQEPPWPGFKELPDDACEAIILPKDLERACKVGEAVLQSRFDSVGLATQGNGVSLGLGTDVVSAPTVEGRFPKLDQVVPKNRPLFTFRVDPKTLAETLLAMADLLPDQ